MFYPVESLKRGGRFYLCWVADSWPQHFAMIKHRQLWSQDVRKICDDLMDVMKNESGRPTNRFSLRLSSQLMRGLVRLYDKKVNVFLNDLCMINANVTKCTNRKYNIPESIPRPQPQVLEPLPRFILSEESEDEQQIEEIIRNGGNVSANIEDITLREDPIPEILLPPNDGFGEENPELALLPCDCTVEMMLAAPDACGHHSALELALELALDLTDKSHDKSRRVLDTQMERISEHDATIFTKSHGEELIPGDLEKEIQIPEIPDIPEIPIPQDQLPLEPEIVEAQRPVLKIPTVQEPEEIVLEELEDAEPQAKRRRIKRIIIDKKIKIGGKILRARINDPNIELRCKDSSDDIVELRVPLDVYMNRPCHAGSKLRSNLALGITRLFMRNLGVVHRSPRAERDFQEEIMHPSQKPHTRSSLEQIQEVEEPAIPKRIQPQIEQNISYPENITHLETMIQDLNFSKDKMDVTKNIADTLAQKIDSIPPQDRKRTSALEGDSTMQPKKQRACDIGYATFRANQEKLRAAMETTVPVVIEPEIHPFPINKETDKENIAENMQNIQETRPSKDAKRSVTAMLQQAGLADIQTQQAVEPPPHRETSRRQASERSETPLGSLDRTKVSLGDLDQTTDLQRFTREQWGTEGTMLKILNLIRKGLGPITVSLLISKGPVLSGHKRIMAARCFNSILKLKQHGFISIKKCAHTPEIEDIVLGKKLY